jgi:hypothetical protein
MTISIYAVDSWRTPVGSGKNGARYCTIEGVAKMNTPDHPFCVANEFIAGRLAMLLGLPVPPGIIVEGPEKTAGYVALRFLRGKPPPACLDELVEDHPRLAAGIVAFDCWIHNPDRHAQNLAYSRGDVPVICFDHDRALAGKTTDLATTFARSREGHKGQVALCSLLESQEDIEHWAERISDVSDDALGYILDEIVGSEALKPPEADAFRQFLMYRQNRVVEMLKLRLQLPKIDWREAS